MPATPLIDDIRRLVSQAMEAARKDGVLRLETTPDIQVEHPGIPSTVISPPTSRCGWPRATRINPMDLAQALVARIPECDPVASVEPAPPGFINFRLKDSWLQQQVEAVRQARATFGNIESGSNRRVMVEFVSVNPTGPVHVGHTRGAVLGSALANVLEAAGYDVTREYYVNDAGSQMDAFYRSVLARYRQSFGKEGAMPSNGYMGEYITELAQEIADTEGERFLGLAEEQAIREIGDLGRGKDGQPHPGRP